jgi:hypothetical protein
MPSARRRWLLCGVVGTLLGILGHPIRAGTALTVGIAPQPVAAALSEFAHQTGLQLVYVSQDARARASKGARAGLSAAVTTLCSYRSRANDSGKLPDLALQTVRIIFSPIG